MRRGGERAGGAMPAAFWHGWRLRERRGMAEGFGRVNAGRREEGLAGGDTGNANVCVDNICKISVLKLVNME